MRVDEILLFSVLVGRTAPGCSLSRANRVKKSHDHCGMKLDLIHPEVLVRIQLVTRPFWSYTLVLLVIVIFSSFFLPPS